MFSSWLSRHAGRCSPSFPEVGWANISKLMSIATIGPHTIDDLLKTPHGESGSLSTESCVWFGKGPEHRLDRPIGSQVGELSRREPSRNHRSRTSVSIQLYSSSGEPALAPDIDFIPNHHLGKYDPKANVQVDVIPSLVVEILSPSTREDDLGPKKEIYREAGVEEYWVIDIESDDPERQKVMKFRLREDPDRPVESIPFTGVLTSDLFPGFSLALEEVSRSLGTGHGEGLRPLDGTSGFSPNPIPHGVGQKHQPAARTLCRTASKKAAKSGR